MECCRIIGLLMPVCLVFSSCSVKEDRTDCPSYLNIDLDGLIESGDYRESLVSVSSDHIIKQENITLAPYEDIGYEVAVPRRTIRASVVAGIKNASWHGDTLVYTENAEADALYAWYSTMVCDRDMMHVTPVLHKQYCLVSLNVVGFDEETHDFDLRLKADCCALRLYDMKPVGGPYTAMVRLSNSGAYTVRIPRQAENNMKLEFLLPQAKSTYDETDIVSTFDVGADMASQGYDWNKEDLDDVCILVDLVQAKVKVELREWTRSDIVVDL